jgi:hypothetical protein
MARRKEFGRERALEDAMEIFRDRGLRRHLDRSVAAPNEDQPPKRVYTFRGKRRL